MKNIQKFCAVIILLTLVSIWMISASDTVRAARAGTNGDLPTYNPGSIDTYVKDPYHDYVTEKTAYHNEKYQGKELKPHNVSQIINAFDYYGFDYTSEDYVEVINKNSNAAYAEAKNELLLQQKDQGMVTWKINVTEPGFYNVLVRYYPIEGYSSSIERGFAINGAIPFDSADNFTFSRIWKDSPSAYENGSLKTDVKGNDIKPQQVEDPMFRETYLKDGMGYVTEPYMFYFDEGVSYITLYSVKEPILLDTLELKSVKESLTYEAYQAKMEQEHGSVEQINLENQFARVEAEKAAYKSSPTLYPVTDRSSSATTPFSLKLTKLNSIGGTSWKVLGDWITWNVEVPESGYYHISMRAKQNAVRGMYSSRILYVNDEVLFQELNDIQFSYSNKWQNVTVGNQDGEYLFYLEKGANTITMEVTLGAYAPLIERTQAVIDKLSALYRQIISYTTVAPDPGRDYQLTQKFPTLIDDLTAYGKELRAISAEITRISGTKSDKTGVIDSVAVQVEDFIKRPRTIPSRLSTFSNNISSMGTLLNSLRELPLMVDYIMVHTPDVTLPKANEGFFTSLWNSIVSFVYSFIIDYSSIGETTEGTGDQSIEVWMTLGRDQANVIRSLIDTNFTPKTGIRVDLKLTGADVLLKATLAGIGPDVALNVDSTLPVNYALRNAVLDLREFPDFKDVLYRVQDGYSIPNANDGVYITQDQIASFGNVANMYMDSSVRQFEFYDGKKTGTYALPEKQIFLMMFVRDDIMEELGLSDMIPETWDEVIKLVAELQAQQLQFYLPVNDLGATALNPIFVSLLYQYGGELYTNNNKETGLLSEEAMRAFEFWTELYTLYSFPKASSFLNRFRSGEQPIGISYYETYNSLSVFAPELKGKWSFHMIPGTQRTDKDGNTYIDHTATASGTGCVILKQPALKSEAVKNNSWDFLKWWTSTETQTAFGREMEGILGSAARHTTANVNALQGLAWPNADIKMLMDQWAQVHELPQIAGSYMTGREVENAYRQVINNMYNPRETLYEYAQNINNEIDRKRSEFGLELRD